jgi:two-component system, NtrC family, response regulator AlgB
MGPTEQTTGTGKVAERMRLESRLPTLQQAIRGEPEAGFPCASVCMRQALETARRVAASHSALLIQGELGVGKGRLARMIHAWSGRFPGAYAAVSCATGSAESLEAELFGVSACSAPGATPDHDGRIAFCEGGTLVLQDVADFPRQLQPRLVRLLRDREYEQGDDLTSRRADVRVIATTRANLRDVVRSRSFQQDLLLALDVVTIEIPPLRERPDDVRVLAERFRADVARETRRAVTGFTPDALDALLKHSYPGNTRELRNLIERAVLLCDGPDIDLAHLPPNLLNAGGYRVGDLVSLEKITDLHIQHVLASTRSYEAAANVLGINSITLWRRRKRYGLTALPPKMIGPP